MVKNSPNIYKTNKHLSRQATEHTKKTTTGFGLAQAQESGRLKPVKPSSSLYLSYVYGLLRNIERKKR